MTDPTTTTARSLSDIVRDEIATLTALERVLIEEDGALRSLNYGKIDQAREAKENYDQRLQALIASRPAGEDVDPDLRKRHLELCSRVKTQAHQNRVRIEACYTGIRELVRTLTGQKSVTYSRGRSATANAVPVLASVVE